MGGVARGGLNTESTEDTEGRKKGRTQSDFLQQKHVGVYNESRGYVKSELINVVL